MRILAVGVATLDIIDRVSDYPAEDSKIRADSRRQSRGGNAANTAVVLSQLGHHCSWAGSLAEDVAADLIKEDFHHHGVDISWAKTHGNGLTPTSYIILSRNRASRTIIHYRDLPEFDLEAFSSIDLSTYDWIHFEGRSVEQCRRMMALARKQSADCRLSLEVEKPRDGIEQLFPLADVLLFSRAYADAPGEGDPRQLFSAVRRVNPTARQFAAWGEDGGWSLCDDDVIHLSAERPPQLVDTLGAGDVFNAGVIHGLSKGMGARDSLSFAIRLAGLKCGQIGLDGLGDMVV